uniref:Ragulator complex protein LAMTOR3 n=1 Tax=Astatotilapia calliptera TaxID=8154 RepID=A0AAX7SVI7_ASTCA
VLCVNNYHYSHLPAVVERSRYLDSCHGRFANDNAPVHALRPGFLSTFALATDQGSKLGLSKNKSIICYYNAYQIVQFNRLPLVISFIAGNTANTGLIMSLEKELASLIEELRQVVEVT